MARARYAAAHKFSKLDALHKEGASIKIIRRMSDNWTKRQMNNPKGYHKAANAKPSMCVVVAV